MKFLCLAYGDGKDFEALSKEKQDELFRQDRLIRDGGALMGAVQPDVVTVTAWDGVPKSVNGAFGELKAPLAGFSLIEASSLDEVVQLVSQTPCARAKGAIEIRPILTINDEQFKRG